MFKWLFCESDYVWKELGLCKAFMLNESLRFWMGYNFGRIATGSAADVEVSNSNQPREVSCIQTFFSGQVAFQEHCKSTNLRPTSGCAVPKIRFIPHDLRQGAHKLKLATQSCSNSSSSGGGGAVISEVN